MKIAICSTGNNDKAKIDPRFGRCSYFALYDKETKQLSFVNNQAKEALEGAGPAAAQFLASQGVSMVVSGEFGGKVKTIFDKLNIQMVVISDPEKDILSILELIKNQ